MENGDFDAGRALINAASSGDTNMVSALLDGGADINGKSDKGMTALMEAVKGNHQDTVQVLLQRGADVNIKGPYLGYEAIVLAVKAGNAEIVELILHSGFDTSLTDINFVLGVARLLGDTRIIGLLDQRKERTQ